MREIEKRRGSNNKDEGLPAKSNTRDRKLLEKNGRRNFKEKEIGTRPSSGKSKATTLVSVIKPGTEASNVSDDMDKPYDDDTSMSKDDDSQNLELDDICNGKINDNSSDMEIVDESDAENATDLVSSHGESGTTDEGGKPEVGPEKLLKNLSSDGYSPKRSKPVKEENSKQIEASNGTVTEGTRLEKVASKSVAKSSSDNLRNMKVHPKPRSDFVDVADRQPVEKDEVSEILADTDNGAHVLCSDEEAAKTEKIGKEEDMAADKKIEDMETRIKKLESELREVAAFEIALYSVIPEHGSSVYKVHTPARRLSRLYIHGCKYWSQDERASMARNTVSGLVLAAKSCGNDVSRLTFWLSNAVVLRELLSQVFGSSCPSSSTILESNAVEANSSPMKWKIINGTELLNKQKYLQLFDDWQETRTFTAALEKVESWIFSRIVESIWWQTLTPNMQPSVGGIIANRATERLLGPVLGDRKQGDYSINHWKNAFHDALKRLCPVRAGEHECGCLPVLARKVMEQCVGRLDVAMFNAILRESVHEIPTDPVSDPIVDSKVLPIPAGDLSFGSGAQLKNSVGNWARWLSDFLGMIDDSSTIDGKEDHISGNRDGNSNEKGTGGPKTTFPLLNALSDLLMLPKDLLLDRTVRTEVCPSISIPLVKRILCNFSPDEFCPDPVPGTVLEALNAEWIIDRRLSGGSSSSFPYAASPVLYTPPSSLDVSEKVAEASPNSPLSRSTSFMHRKGYTSDEELDELESCLSSVISKSPSSLTTAKTNGRASREDKRVRRSNARYDLLREVWRSA